MYESVTLRQATPRKGQAPDHTNMDEKTDMVASLWAWAVCPSVFLFSYIPMLNLVARGILVSFILWLIWACTAGGRRVCYPTLPLWFIGWTFLALGISLLAVDLNLAIRKWFTVFSLGIISWGVANSVVWSRSVRPWGWAYLLSALAAYISNYLPIEQLLVVEYTTEIYGRYAGTLGNANAFGRAMVQAFFVGLGMLHFYARGKQALATILVMGALGLATIESSSRTAMLGLGIGVVSFYMSIRIRNLLTPLNVTALFGVITGIVAVLTYFPKHFFTSIERMKVFFSFLGLTPEVKTSERSIDHRVELANKAFQVWQDYPLGVGLDNFRTFVGTYAHSNYLEILVATGFLGLVFYYAPYFILYFREISGRRQRADLPWLRYCAGVILAIAVMDMFNVSYYSKSFWLFAGFFCGAIVLRNGNARLTDPK